MIDANTPAGTEVWELCPFDMCVGGPFRLLHMDDGEAVIDWILEEGEEPRPFSSFHRELGDLFMTQREAILALVAYRQQRLDEAIAELAAHDADQAEATP